MTSAEKTTILRFAAGDSGLRNQAIEIYRSCFRAGEGRTSPEMRFMSEIDTPVPDLALRATARKELIGEKP